MSNIRMKLLIALEYLSLKIKKSFKNLPICTVLFLAHKMLELFDVVCYAYLRNRGHLD